MQASRTKQGKKELEKEGRKHTLPQLSSYYHQTIPPKPSPLACDAISREDTERLVNLQQCPDFGGLLGVGLVEDAFEVEKEKKEEKEVRCECQVRTALEPAEFVFDGLSGGEEVCGKRDEEKAF